MQMGTTLGTAGAQAAGGLRTVSSPAVSPWSCSSPLPPQCPHRAPAWAVLGASPPEPPQAVGATMSLQKANLGCCFVLRAQKKPSQAGWLHFFRLRACMRQSPPCSFGGGFSFGGHQFAISKSVLSHLPQQQVSLPWAAREPGERTPSQTPFTNHSA